jgi:hypothetical protein
MAIGKGSSGNTSPLFSSLVPSLDCSGCSFVSGVGVGAPGIDPSGGGGGVGGGGDGVGVGGGGAPGIDPSGGGGGVGSGVVLGPAQPRRIVVSSVKVIAIVNSFDFLTKHPQTFLSFRIFEFESNPGLRPITGGNSIWPYHIPFCHLGQSF